MYRNKLLAYASVGLFLCMTVALPVEASSRSGHEHVRDRIEDRVEKAEDRVAYIITRYCEKFKEYQDTYGTRLPSFCEVDEDPPSPVAPVITFTANPYSIVSGESSELSWTSTGALSCTASDGWSGSKTLSGNTSVAPSSSTWYRLTCANASTSTSKGLIIDVTEAPPPPESGKLLLSEVYYDTDTAHGTDASNEWIEIYNDSSSARDLTGYSIIDGNLADQIATGTTIAAHGYLVIANSTTTAAFWSFPVSATVVYLDGPVGNGLGNSGDALFLRDDSQQVIDAVSWGSNTTALNPAVIGGGDGVSIERIDPAIDTDTALDWQTSSTPTPGA